MSKLILQADTQRAFSITPKAPHSYRITTVMGVMAFLYLARVASAGPEVHPQEPSASSSSIMGKELYEKACARCHGSDGKGDRPDIKLNAPMPNFARCAESAEEPDIQYRRTIEKGGIIYGLSDEMPAYGEVLSREQIDSLLLHMRQFCTDRRWVRGEMNFPRPIFTEKAYPENELVLKPALRRSHEKGYDLTLQNFFERRVGPRTQVEVIFPVRSVDSKDGGSRSRRNEGVGDFELGIKQVWYSSLPRRLLISSGMDVGFPTGRSKFGLGKGTAIFEPFVAIGKGYRGWAFQTSLHFEIPANIESAERVFAFKIAVGFPVHQFGVRQLFGTLEIIGDRELKSAKPAPTFLVPQVRLPIDRIGRFAFSVGPLIPVNQRSINRVGFAAFLLWEYAGR